MTIQAFLTLANQGGTLWGTWDVAVRFYYIAQGRQNIKNAPNIIRFMSKHEVQHLLSKETYWSYIYCIWNNFLSCSIPNSRHSNDNIVVLFLYDKIKLILILNLNLQLENTFHLGSLCII